jgi:hypothetical protein
MNGGNTALDRVLDRRDDNSNNNLNWTTTADWRSIQRIVRRQASRSALQHSLERLVEEPHVPLPLIRLLVNRFVDAEPRSGDASTRNRNSTDTIPNDGNPCLGLCVRNIWHRLLVNRDGPAFRAFTNTVDTRHEAHEHYTRELLNITDAASFNSNEPIRRAFEKTRLLAQTMCQREQTTSFASLVMVHHLPPFLLWLAVVDDPECLVTVNNGTLPLHEAMKASVACRRPVQPNRIHFKAATSSSGDPLSSEQIKLIELFNKTTAVQLLCHLSPRACKIAHAPSPEDPPRLPLDMFLSSLALEQERIRREGHFQWILFTHELLQDIRAIIAKAPQALETRSLPTRVYPFCLPQLNWSNSSVSVSSSASIRCEDDNVAIATECFLLTLNLVRKIISLDLENSMPFINF